MAVDEDDDAASSMEEDNQEVVVLSCLVVAAVDSWEEDEEGSEVSPTQHDCTPLASFRARVRTQTEESTLAQYSRRLLSRTLSNIKATGHGVVSKMVHSTAIETNHTGSTTTKQTNSATPYTMTQDNPFCLMDHDAASVTSTVSSISLDSARRLAEHVSAEQPRPPPTEIQVKIPGPMLEDWQAAWVQGGTPTSREEELPPLPRSPLPRSPHTRPSKTTTLSPSLSRVHTDTTVTSLTTHTLLAGRPKRAVTTGATVFSFGSRVGESSVSSPDKLVNKTTVNKKVVPPPAIWKNFTAPVKRWTATPAKLCRSQTGCMA